MQTTTQAAHTPGPWRVNASLIEGPRMGLRIAVVDWPKLGCAPAAKDEAKANACLIAAAPDFAQGARAFIEYEKAVAAENSAAAMVHYATAARLLRAAIAKAEGRT